MQFGIPSKKSSRKANEKFPNDAVLTISAANTEEGSKKSRPMILNSKAEEVLGLDKKAEVAFTFNVDEDGNSTGVFILNADVTEVPDRHKLRVTKSSPRKINDKKTVNYLADILKLDNSVENNFYLNKVVNSDQEFEYFEVSLVKEGEVKNGDEIEGALKETPKQELSDTPVENLDVSNTGPDSNVDDESNMEKNSINDEDLVFPEPDTATVEDAFDIDDI